MRVFNADLMRVLWAGLIAGIIWGWLAMGVNAVTGVFPFESTVLHNLSAFTIAGGLMGVLSALFLLFARGVSPFKGIISNAVAASVVLWLLFRGIGALLTYIDHARFHVDTLATMQGLALAIILGLFIGVAWTKRVKEV